MVSFQNFLEMLSKQLSEMINKSCVNNIFRSKILLGFNKREYLVNILIMHERHFHFLSVVADRLQDGLAACPQLRNESESAARALLKC